MKDKECEHEWKNVSDQIKHCKKCEVGMFRPDWIDKLKTTYEG